MTETSKNIPVSPHHSHPMIPACLMATAISHRDDYREMENHLQIKAPRPSVHFTSQGVLHMPGIDTPHPHAASHWLEGKE